MKKSITGISCSLLLLIYPMFLMGFVLGGFKALSLADMAWLVIGLGLNVTLGLCWNIWILVSVTQEKESLEERLTAMAKKASEIRPQEPAVVAPSAESSSAKRRQRHRDDRDVQGWRPS